MTSAAPVYQSPAISWENGYKMLENLSVFMLYLNSEISAKNKLFELSRFPNGRFTLRFNYCLKLQVRAQDNNIVEYIVSSCQPPAIVSLVTA
jgi:hypothetical protein